ncbi:TMEM175 family protein [Pengzhenrongella sp.]|uniref:TMEM175 family protein n=1 Tax=Pengzhenrongella sp. TaxID=2888820 RepID=UPI002F91FA7E
MSMSTEGLSTGRLEAFSDGVFAIVVTLLILDIKVPIGANGHLATELAGQWPQYLAYLVSFLIVGILWLNHHATVALLARTNHTIHVLNLLLLLPVSTLPWPTALLSQYAADGDPSDQRVAVLIYGITSSLMAVGFNLLWRYLLRHPELRRAGVTPESLRVRNTRYNIGLTVYPIATLLGLLSVPLFLFLMLALAGLFLLPTPELRGHPGG